MTSFYQQLTTSQETQDIYWHNMVLLSKMDLVHLSALDDTMSWNNWWTD